MFQQICHCFAEAVSDGWTFNGFLILLVMLSSKLNFVYEPWLLNLWAFVGCLSPSMKPLLPLLPTP